jgi:hypothetical protein
MRFGSTGRGLVLGLLAIGAVGAGSVSRVVQDSCGPFTDVSPVFCPYVLEVYYTGISAGTSATTFSPNAALTRGQGAVFAAKGLDQALARSSRRAALNQSWTTAPHWDIGLGLTTVGAEPSLLQSDGTDLWVPNFADGTVTRVRASDGRVLETWTGATNAYGALCAMGRVFVTNDTTASETPGSLYMIDPTQPAGDVTVVASPLGVTPLGIAFDGSRIWTANYAGGGPTVGSVSIVTPGPTIPWSVTTVTTGFHNPWDIVFDGTSMWVADQGDNTLKKLDGDGAIVGTVPIGGAPGHPVFDGANLWVPDNTNSVIVVVRASTGAVMATVSGNGLNQPLVAAFDGQRVLVTNPNVATISLFRAADLSPLGTFSTGSNSLPYGVASDGVQFWVSLANAGKVARY